jgi:hypothetical protein
MPAVVAAAAAAEAAPMPAVAEAVPTVAAEAAEAAAEAAAVAAASGSGGAAAAAAEAGAVGYGPDLAGFGLANLAQDRSGRRCSVWASHSPAWGSKRASAMRWRASSPCCLRLADLLARARWSRVG